MAHVVGPKGQVVITKEIRDRLGVEPGWIALQRLSGDHIEIYFIPPEHKKSLKGQLAGHIREHITSEGDWNTARDTAWKTAAKEKIKREEKAS